MRFFVQLFSYGYFHRSQLIVCGTISSFCWVFLDSIEGHVIRAHDDVENANEQLQKATVYRVRYMLALG